jgi:Phage integrase family
LNSASYAGRWVGESKARRPETWVGFHTFRHTAATILFRAGWNAIQVQKQLGHSDPGFTQRVYVHLLPEDLPDPSFLDELTAPGVGNERATEATESDRNAAPSEAPRIRRVERDSSDVPNPAERAATSS